MSNEMPKKLKPGDIEKLKEEYYVKPNTQDVDETLRTLAETEVGKVFNEYGLPKEYTNHRAYNLVALDAKLEFPYDKELQRLRIIAMMHIHTFGELRDLTTEEREKYEKAKDELFNTKPI